MRRPPVLAGRRLAATSWVGGKRGNDFRVLNGRAGESRGRVGFDEGVPEKGRVRPVRQPHKKSALRVIRLQAKTGSKVTFKKTRIWFTKMKISQKLTIRLRREQFSSLGQVTTYPEMHPLCLSMRYTEISTGGQILWCSEKLTLARDFSLARRFSIKQCLSSLVRPCPILVRLERSLSTHASLSKSKRLLESA